MGVGKYPALLLCQFGQHGIFFGRKVDYVLPFPDGAPEKVNGHVSSFDWYLVGCRADVEQVVDIAVQLGRFGGNRRDYPFVAGAAPSQCSCRADDGRQTGGFMDEVNVPELLRGVDIGGSPINMMDTSFFMSRQTPLASEVKGMAIWREKLFAWMMRNAQSPMEFFCLPPNRVVEMGAQVRI